jgi:hypothetical protein
VGDAVAEGDLCSELLFPENPKRASIPLYFEAVGEGVCQRHPARTEPATAWRIWPGRWLERSATGRGFAYQVGSPRR